MLKQTGNYGAKTKAYLNREAVECVNHGFHTNWYYNKKSHQVTCRICHNSRTKKQHDNKQLRKLLWNSQQRKDKENTLTLIDLALQLIKQKGKCALTGIPFGTGEFKCSLDRIDSSKGYTKDNIQFLLWGINRMKLNMQQSTFIKMCKAVAYEQSTS